MNFTVPDNRPFIAKDTIKTKAHRTETRTKVRELFSTYSLKITYDRENGKQIVKAEPKK